MTLSQISIVLKDLRTVVEKLKFETVSIAKTDLVNNVLWNDIKSLLQLAIQQTKLIICNELIKYPPKNLRSIIIADKYRRNALLAHWGTSRRYVSQNKTQLLLGKSKIRYSTIFNNVCNAN